MKLILAERPSAVASDSVMYFCNDGNMNVTAAVDTSGNVARRYEYTPYGQVTELDPDFTSYTGSDYDVQILFAGYRHDPDTGLYHVRHRGYHPTLGRWITRDPAAYSDGMSLYEYVGSGPTISADTHGLHRDFNPDGNRPKPIAGRKSWEISGWANSMHLSLYSHYMDFLRWTHDNSDVLIIGGTFLTDVQGQSEQIAFEKRVHRILEKSAETVLIEEAKSGGTSTFSHRGWELISSDLISSNVRLSLGRYTVYWGANCIVGPMESETDADCGSNCRGTAHWSCKVNWTVFDIYDHAPYVIVALGGKPFDIYGYWNRREAGSVTACVDRDIWRGAVTIRHDGTSRINKWPASLTTGVINLGDFVDPNK